MIGFLILMIILFASLGFKFKNEYDNSYYAMYKVRSTTDGLTFEDSDCNRRYIPTKEKCKIITKKDGRNYIYSMERIADKSDIIPNLENIIMDEEKGKLLCIYIERDCYYKVKYYDYYYELLEEYNKCVQFINEYSISVNLGKKNYIECGGKEENYDEMVNELPKKQQRLKEVDKELKKIYDVNKYGYYHIDEKMKELYWDEINEFTNGKRYKICWQISTS